MRLFAAIVPPREVLDEVDEVVRSVWAAQTGRRSWTRPVAAPAASARRHAAPRRGPFGRSGGEPDQPSAAESAAPHDPHDLLDRLPVARMLVPVVTFGHLTRVDSEKLAGALREAAAAWVPPTLRLAGGTALEFPGDKAVWATLDGDLDRLQGIVQDVPRVVQRLALFVDRRQFRPWLSVGTITDQTTAPYLEDLVAALERFEGMTWTQDSLSLMSGHPEAGPSEPFEELEAMPLAAP